VSSSQAAIKVTSKVIHSALQLFLPVGVGVTPNILNFVPAVSVSAQLCH
jgi:hypothetical protein